MPAAKIGAVLANELEQQQAAETVQTQRRKS